MSHEETSTGFEDVWYLKEIFWSSDLENPKQPINIITQNFNGPCSFIAICNILILRNQIHVEPRGRTSVSYEYLSNLVAEYLLSTPTEYDPSSALSILPVTRKGMDLNPQFTAVSSFRPAGDGGELKLFDLTGIRLVHGWLVDPDSSEFDVISRVEDYDTSVNLIVSADHLTKGQLVRASEDFESLVMDVGGNWTPEEREKVEDAIIIRDFLERTSGQLTYYGLFQLASTDLEPGALVALFRGSHLSVLYKSADPERPGLYTLVTDQIFAQEPSVVWERLEDVEGGASTFVDSDFVKASPAGGDFAGRSAEAVRQDYEADEIDADQALAQQLQHEEDARAQALHIEQQRRREEQERRQAAENDAAQNYGSIGNLESGMANLEVQPEKKKRDCIIM
ncbi:hypothetical protein JB92DRAFT_426292 [Gautieria morchelliformis]|nr:hypothetical protein JB92DRAFT_426292 [Gautieria morchelliformis]